MAGLTTLVIPVPSVGKVIPIACFPMRMDSLPDRDWNLSNHKPPNKRGPIVSRRATTHEVFPRVEHGNGAFNKSVLQDDHLRQRQRNSVCSAIKKLQVDE